MGQEDSKKNDSKRAARELLEGGRDVAIGREIIELLSSEGVGVKITTEPKGQRKVDVLIDRKPGEEDFSVRENVKENRRLLGIVLPTREEKDEYVFVLAEEEGFVFKAGEYQNHYDPEVNVVLELRGWERFGDYFNVALSGISRNMSRVISEGKAPEKFEEIVVNAVQKERQCVLENKAKRADVRQSLLDRLFGNG